jgi:hypothetical protein
MELSAQLHGHIQWVTGAVLQEVKQAEREAEHSPSSSVEVEERWSYTSTPSYVFTAECLTN